MPCLLVWAFIFNSSLYVGTVKVQCCTSWWPTCMSMLKVPKFHVPALFILIPCFENDDCFVPQLVFDAYI